MIYDCVVIGASAAGLMTAITAKSKGIRLLVLEGQKKPGAKILMSGGTRCNVTNKNVTENDYESENLRFVKHVLSAFPSAKTITFFENLGVRFVCEEGGKYFPTTHSGKTILDALLNCLEKNKIELQLNRRVDSIERYDDGFIVKGSGFSLTSRTVVLCTGGLSYPSTGSDGGGYAIAQLFGHTLVRTMPSLTPFTTDDADWKSISGTALPCRLTLKSGKDKKVFEGDFLFTHFGFSGPVSLNMSRHWLRLKESSQRELYVNWLPDWKEEDLKAWIIQYANQFPKRLVKTLLAEKLPERFVEIFLKKLKLNSDMIINQLTGPQRNLVVKELMQYPLEVSGVVGYSKAEATAGGINLNEIDSRTMESGKQPGLFFAGEICDVDGRIGGFNFQWAWASGYAAGRGVIARLGKGS